MTDGRPHSSSKNATLDCVDPLLTFWMVEYLLSPLSCCSWCSWSSALTFSSTFKSSISVLSVLSCSWRCFDFSRYSWRSFSISRLKSCRSEWGRLLERHTSKIVKSYLPTGIRHKGVRCSRNRGVHKLAHRGAVGQRPRAQAPPAAVGRRGKREVA